jgi:hypothetical protein
LERIGFIGLFLFFWQLSAGQLTFSAAVFPDPGDSLVYQKDIVNLPDNISPGSNNTWDFRFLQTPLFNKQVLKPSPFFNEVRQAGKVYVLHRDELDYLYVNDGNSIQEIGFLLKVGKSQKVIPVYYTNPLSWDSGSLDFNQKRVISTDFRFTLARSDLPRNIQQDIPESIEQFSITGNKSLIRHTDAWGELLLPGEDVLVNRVRVAENNRIRIYNEESGKLIPFFDEDMIRQIVPMRGIERYYEFYSQKYLHITARIRVDNQNMLSTIDFQSRKTVASPVNTTDSRSDFVLYPNPTYNIAKIFITNRPTGRYGLAIYNIIGKKLWHRDIRVDGETIVKENFGFLPKGTYLISLVDENNNILRTTRLIIISV